MTATEKSNKIFWIDQDFRNEIYQCLSALAYVEPRISRKLQACLDDHTLLRDWCEDASSSLRAACLLAAYQVKGKNLKIAKRLAEATEKHNIERANPDQRADSDSVKSFSALYLD